MQDIGKDIMMKLPFPWNRKDSLSQAVTTTKTKTVGDYTMDALGLPNATVDGGIKALLKMLVEPCTYIHIY